MNIIVPLLALLLNASAIVFEQELVCPPVLPWEAGLCLVMCGDSEPCDDGEVCCSNDCGGRICVDGVGIASALKTLLAQKSTTMTPTGNPTAPATRFIYGYKAAKAGSRALVKYMDDYNTRVMGGTLSRLVEVTEEQKKQLLKGWLVMDKKQRIWCFEGPPSVVADLYQFVSTQTSIQKHGRGLYHPQCRWTKRLYSALPLRLYVVKLRRALRHLLIARVDRGGDSLSRLGELQLCRSIWHLKTMRSVWPTVEDLDDIHTKYGDFVSDSELLGGCFGDEEDRASKKRMGRSNSVTTAASSPRTEEEGSQREGRAEESTAGEGFGTQERPGGVESSNSSFEQVLRERRRRKGKMKRKDESNALEDSIRRALQSRRTYDGASGP
ncbi:hypothetical protein FOZ63_002700, partial [Perkinsus olseni]